MVFELSDVDFVGQLGGGGRVAFQGEGIVQGLSVIVLYAGEWDFLQGRRGREEGYGVQSLVEMSKEYERLNSNYDDDDDDRSKDNCLSDVGGIVVEIMFQYYVKQYKYN